MKMNFCSLFQIQPINSKRFQGKEKHAHKSKSDKSCLKSTQQSSRNQRDTEQMSNSIKNSKNKEKRETRHEFKYGL